ncbi:MAG: Na(+)-translocating NADH-quinone reductase subunit C [Gemmatimonadota bacterium]
MARTDSTRYTFLFAAAVCIVCALLVSVAAVGLRDRQETNARLYRQKNVLLAAGLVKPGEELSDRELLAVFDRNIRIRLVDLKSGELLPQGRIDEKNYDQRRARNDPQTSYPAPPNDAQIQRLPRYAAVYLVQGKEGGVEQVVLPVEGVGMWGTCYGFIALDRDGNTVRGLTFYDQKETPGLGGEISNPKWQALWHGRKVFDAQWQPKLTVIKGHAGPPDQDPHRIDALSGATITSNGVARLMAFWFSDAGFGPYLKHFREGTS